MKRTFSLLLVALILSASSTSWASHPVAWVALDSGKGEPRRVAIRMAQIISTGSSKAELHLGEYCLVRLKPHSRLELRMLDLNSRYSRVQMKLVEGTALVWMGAKRSDGSQFLISTPAAVVSGHGAAVIIEAEKSSTLVKVIDGAVSAADLVEENDRGEAMEGLAIDVPARHQLLWEEGIPAEAAEPILPNEMKEDVEWINEPLVPGLKKKEKFLTEAPEVLNVKLIAR